MSPHGIDSPAQRFPLTAPQHPRLPARRGAIDADESIAVFVRRFAAAVGLPGSGTACREDQRVHSGVMSAQPVQGAYGEPRSAAAGWMRAPARSSLSSARNAKGVIGAGLSVVAAPCESATDTVAEPVLAATSFPLCRPVPPGRPISASERKACPAVAGRRTATFTRWLIDHGRGAAPSPTSQRGVRRQMSMRWSSR